MKALTQNVVGKKRKIEMRKRTDMPHMPMTCNPHTTTKTASVWDNAIRRPDYAYARKLLSSYPNPESLFSSFLGQ